ncbi:TetR-like C-terminal domain-containing protein [Salinarimonas ramus]|uniref:TetR family transcriptional regulator n=1 Tax=Salinarimonas ramus TaxID=690164 RepID=A0A917QKN0_9HYPH|nr:TetR-like C-terminal domain-containing protein [Salinarimonas ramus]GGK55675.1 TetR family transcriptional regulator [Salinarimonas ramus]
MERKCSDQKKKRTPSGAAVPRAELTDALYQAFFAEWAEKGFAAVSLERVAARAGAGKAAIYRRWSSRSAFAAEAVEALGLRMAVIEDRGSLEADVTDFLFRLRVVLRHPLVRRILPDLHAEAARSPEMRGLNTRIASQRRAPGAGLLERAVARGELPASLDTKLALDLIPAPLYWRMVVLGATPSRAEVTKMASAVTAGLRALA